ncbi:S-layer homology domain-containing protein [Salisediminibacterium beveridgei]|uniref:S-layer homology domain-containing protein n=1 Tax=Salisediminibacterium beveridgei TaxID=632773 RepID=UPI0018DBA357|nr:S-layer homology domain-containing protein [Salisediminibacterium beveridgei]
MNRQTRITDDIMAAYDAGSFEGNLDGELMPQANTKRSEAAKIILSVNGWL